MDNNKQGVRPSRLPQHRTPAPRLRHRANRIHQRCFHTHMNDRLFILVLQPRTVARTQLRTPNPTNALHNTNTKSTLHIRANRTTTQVRAQSPHRSNISRRTRTVSNRTNLNSINHRRRFTLTSEHQVGHHALHDRIRFAIRQARRGQQAHTRHINRLLVRPAGLHLPQRRRRSTTNFIIRNFRSNLSRA